MEVVKHSANVQANVEIQLARVCYSSDIQRQLQSVFASRTFWIQKSYRRCVCAGCPEMVTCRWTLDDFLGAGAFGQSYLATHEPTGHRYVMKFLSRDNDRELKFLKQAAGSERSKKPFIWGRL